MSHSCIDGKYCPPPNNSPAALDTDTLKIRPLDIDDGAVATVGSADGNADTGTDKNRFVCPSSVSTEYYFNACHANVLLRTDGECVTKDEHEC